ncbi:MAG: hypothetical protein FJ087_07790 [Deltaproteobacteria bacterium]|nr:hypothetical protein [Deltaproteobacteria bacterium]
MSATAVSAVALQVLLRLWDPSTLSPDAEIVAVSLIRGVNPHLALAVAHAESGGLSEKDGSRDRALYLGNYGRFQINCTTWKKVFGLNECRELWDRHLNIRIGIAVLAYVQAMHGWRAGPPYWVAHYNEGVLLQPDGPGERYARKVVARMRRMERLAAAAAANWRGW